MRSRLFLVPAILLSVAAAAQAHDMHGAMALPGGFSSPMIPQNGTWSHVFDAAGERAYHCHPHPFMEGHIFVESGAPAAANVTVHIRDYSFQPFTIHIRPGTNVSWVNDDADEHMVTESMLMSTTSSVPSDAPAPMAPVMGLAILGAVLVLRRNRA